MKWLLQIAVQILIITQILGQFSDFYIPMTSDTCPDNMFPLIDEENEEIFKTCVCVFDTMFFPELNNCYKLYRQGPCRLGDYVVPSTKKGVATCSRNPCFQNGLAPFQGKCHIIGGYGPPCGKYFHLEASGLDYQIICIGPSPGSPSGGIINAPRKACPEGTRRTFLGCKKAFQ